MWDLRAPFYASLMLKEKGEGAEPFPNESSLEIKQQNGSHYNYNCQTSNYITFDYVCLLIP
jgi:hypothetical protein